MEKWTKAEKTYEKCKNIIFEEFTSTFADDVGTMYKP